MKSRKFKKIISSVCLLLLAIIMIFSFPVSHVFAQSNTFAGTKIVITTFEKLSEEITEQWVTKDNAAENLVLPKELNATDENGQTILVEGIVWEHEKLNSENQDQEPVYCKITGRLCSERRRNYANYYGDCRRSKRNPDYF